MTSLDKIYNHSFTLEMGDDLSTKDIDKENYTELEYYVNNTQFYFVHFLSLLSQLDNAVSLLNNFSYNKKKQDQQRRSSNLQRGKLYD